MQQVVLALALALAACAWSPLPAAAEDEEPEVVELQPDDPAGFSGTHLFAPITGLFLGGPGYWYSPREVVVRTTPPGAYLDLFYVRRNFQKGYAQAEAPARVVLPSRLEAGSRDHLTIRAFLEGYRQKEAIVRVRSRDEEVLIELEPLSNSLVSVTHLYFAGRASLGFLTKEALTFRVQKRSDEAYSLVLLETAGTPKAAADMQGVRDALLASLSPQQLGEDLVVTIGLTAQARGGSVDLRSRQDYDAVRRLHLFHLDVVPAAGASPVQRARDALARIGPGDVSGCALRFDGALRQGLDPSALHRALTPAGSFLDPYLRAAMKRLGEISPDGAVALADGTRFRTEVPLELAAASSQAEEVHGYLAMLRAFVAELEPAEHRRETLRGLVAPEVSPAAFVPLLEAAEAAERACGSGGARAQAEGSALR
jgi:hypothetical protein